MRGGGGGRVFCVQKVRKTWWRLRSRESAASYTEKRAILTRAVGGLHQILRGHFLVADERNSQGQPHKKRPSCYATCTYSSCFLMLPKMTPFVQFQDRAFCQLRIDRGLTVVIHSLVAALSLSQILDQSLQLLLVLLLSKRETTRATRARPFLQCSVFCQNILFPSSLLLTRKLSFVCSAVYKRREVVAATETAQGKKERRRSDLSLFFHYVRSPRSYISNVDELSLSGKRETPMDHA